MVGCWGTALAQIAYYHELQAVGELAYTCSNGYDIQENLSAHHFDFSAFAAQIDSTSSKKTVDELARYNYYAAAILQKDFGTGGYMNLLAPASLIETHYPVRAKRYVSFRQSFPYRSAKLEKVIVNELNANRPLFLHFANLNDFGHSVVIDAYCYDAKGFKIHINNGQGGEGDGWYAFEKGILRADDTKLRVIYTVAPKE